MPKASNSTTAEIVTDSAENSANHTHSSTQPLKVEHAVILAAGNGQRFQEKGVKLPKVLLKVGGLRLLERAIFSIPTLQNFVKDVAQNPTIPSLACDANLAEVFDMDDATKVVSKNEKIYDIGKEIPNYDLVDMGLFYFPAGYGEKVTRKVANGAKSVSDIINQFIAETGVRTAVVPEAIWQDVDNPSMKKEAERRLVKTLVKKTDGWVSKNINRVFSTRTSMFLAKFNTSPNTVTTFVFFFTLYGAYLVASGEYMKIAIGALIFQIASILDGCDGELARLMYKGSKFGAWYDTITDNIRYIAFFAALGIAGYVNTGSDIYYYASIIVTVMGLYTAATMARFVWNQGGPLTNLEG